MAPQCLSNSVRAAALARGMGDRGWGMGSAMRSSVLPTLQPCSCMHGEGSKSAWLCRRLFLYVLRFTLYAVEVTMSQIQELLAQLVSIDSRNPALVPGGPGETAITSVAADFLRAAGLEVDLVEPQLGRPSAIG